MESSMAHGIVKVLRCKIIVFIASLLFQVFVYWLPWICVAVCGRSLAAERATL